MSNGKMNYERQRARREIRSELYDEITAQYGDPTEVAQQRVMAKYSLYIGAAILMAGGSSQEDASLDAVMLFQCAERDAEQLYPSPPKEDPLASGSQE